MDGLKKLGRNIQQALYTRHRCSQNLLLCGSQASRASDLQHVQALEATSRSKPLL
jgi:hypothetical protein